MAYGTPKSLDHVEAYYTHIRDGRAPAPELLDRLVRRYRAIGGRSPLLDITSEQAAGIERRLHGVKSYLGQKHASPFIADAVRRMARDRVQRAVGLVLAPHFSSMSVGDYARRAQQAAAACGFRGRLDMIESWHLEPGYIDVLSRRLRGALEALPGRAKGRSVVVFTAHSLPVNILERGDPYPQQLEETARAVAARAGVQRWEVGWQSAGRTTEPWLGPDILEIIEELAGNRTPGVVVCPCGFVADHLEILYDLDIEARRLAQRLGIDFVRTASPNADRDFLDVLAGIVTKALDSR
jgi:protoporphyrin/coproporphyrin ferrochelatase